MIKTISPVDGSVVVERESFSEEQITSILDNATKAFQKHCRTPLSTRIEIANKFLDLLTQDKDKLVGITPDVFILTL
jgi:acyl-CoA reductase-like NAD-dependent aldehyde dehydrogenase